MTEQTKDLPLRGFKVIDFTRVLAGPLCTMLLGDMGAEVIKIEDPQHGDETRGWAPFVGTTSTYFASVNRNKKSVAVDIKSPDGVALVEDLIRTADVLVENFRPGTLARLGFGSERAQGLNERLIYCSISGYGATGPRSDEPGYDMVIQGESGLMDVTGFPETGPTKVGVAVTDCLAALYAVQGWISAVMDSVPLLGCCSVRNSSCQSPLLEARFAWPTMMLRRLRCSRSMAKSGTCHSVWVPF